MDGGFTAAPDLLAIFVAGNVLSRGLTLEGLATSLFLRAANEPAADTQMQMQRWFGYRGRHLPFCRLFTYEDQLRLFKSYHENDKALKTEVMRGMDTDNAALTSAMVLQGTSYVATSKVAINAVPLSPGPRPSVRLVESRSPVLARHNLDIVADLRDLGDWVDLRDDNHTLRGVIRASPVTLLEAAEILDSFRYSHHDPEPASELSARWRHYETLLDLNAAIFRPPGVNPQPYAVEPQSCPYSIAAYFRLWDALASTRPSFGFKATDQKTLPWNLDAAAQRHKPSFYLAIRYGGEQTRAPRLAATGARAMVRQLNQSGLALQTLWGTRGYSGDYYGDELVDYYHHRSSEVPKLRGGVTWRPRGDPGLLLFHLIRNDSLSEDLVSVGLGIPHGGPDHISALRP